MYKTSLLAILLAIFSSIAAFGNDVDVYLSNGDVIVIGDSNANDLEIRRLAGNVHQFKGLGRTTVNGSTDPVILPIPDDLKIWMLGGDDFVDIKYLNLSGTTHADLVIEMGRGDDTLKMYNGNVRRNVLIGDDRVFRGDDLVVIYNYSADTIDIETQGAANIAVLYSTVKRIIIEAGLEGRDDINISANRADSVYIDTSNENDSLLFLDNDVAGGDLWVYLNDGDDSMKLGLNTLNDTQAIFDGGDGFDSGAGIREYQGPFWWWWRNVTFPNFESGF